jgi:hypothetical protein
MDLNNSVYPLVLDTLPHPLGIVNDAGQITMVNSAWRTFSCNKSAPNGMFPGAGENYFLELEKSATPAFIKIRTGAQEVLSGRRSTFEMHYSYDCEDGFQRFTVQICPLQVEGKLFLMIFQIHEQDGYEEEGKKIRDDEFQSLSKFNNTSSTQVTAQSFGITPISAGYPHAFAGFTDAYEELLDMVLQEHVFRVDHQRAGRLRDMAAQLGFLKAGPRDVVEIHSTALKNKVQGVPFQKAQAYIAEGRILVLELMGYLTSYYRSRAVNIIEDPGQQGSTK